MQYPHMTYGLLPMEVVNNLIAHRDTEVTHTELESDDAITRACTITLYNGISFSSDFLGALYKENDDAEYGRSAAFEQAKERLIAWFAVYIKMQNSGFCIADFLDSGYIDQMVPASNMALTRTSAYYATEEVDEDEPDSNQCHTTVGVTYEGEDIAVETMQDVAPVDGKSALAVAILRNPQIHAFLDKPVCKFQNAVIDTAARVAGSCLVVDIKAVFKHDLYPGAVSDEERNDLNLTLLTLSQMQAKKRMEEKRKAESND